VVIFFLLFLLVPALEVLAFIEVGLAIGWLWAVVLVFGASLAGVRLLRSQGRAAIAAVSAAVSGQRAPGLAALDGALGVLGAALLAVPGFITDAFGVLLLLPPARRQVRRLLSRHYTARVMSFAATAGRFAGSPRSRPFADAEATAVEEDYTELGS
jgi:UPF0716 protein FxsA